MGPKAARKSADRVGIVVPPPLYAVAGLGAAYALQVWATPPWAVPVALRMAGAAIALLAVASAVWAVATLLRRGTPFDPYQPTTALVSQGPFRLTRNPIYLAFGLGVLGMGLAAGWWWSAATAPLVLLALDRFVVRAEERYLGGKFGAEYEAYRRAVRRWF
jgi:protein-S-isoprenylcysteine O-methyltransferase Ste14